MIAIGLSAVAACWAFRELHPVEVALADTRRWVALGRPQWLTPEPRDLASRMAQRPDLIVSLGWELAAVDENLLAEALLAEGFQGHPFNLNLGTSLAAIRFRLGNITGARQVLDRLAHVGHEFDGWVVRMRANLAISEHDYSSAIGCFEELLAKAPNDAELLVAFGDLLMWDQQFDRAAIQYRAALAEKPDDDSLHLRLARVLSWAAMSEHRLVER